MDPDLVVPNPELSIKDGAITPWAAAVARGEGWNASQVDYVVKLLKIKLGTPWNKLTEQQRIRIALQLVAALQRPLMRLTRAHPRPELELQRLRIEVLAIRQAPDTRLRARHAPLLIQ